MREKKGPFPLHTTRRCVLVLLLFTFVIHRSSRVKIYAYSSTHQQVTKRFVLQLVEEQQQHRRRRRIQRHRQWIHRLNGVDMVYLHEKHNTHALCVRASANCGTLLHGRIKSGIDGLRMVSGFGNETFIPSSLKHTLTLVVCLLCRCTRNHARATSLNTG